MSRYLYLIITGLLLCSFTVNAQNQRKILVEVFTNSHCPLCPTAHNTLDNYLMNNPNGNYISYIYYHMVYPYADDLLYTQSSEGSAARHNYYNPVQATPRGFFDGAIQGSASGWEASLDARALITSPLLFSLSGTKSAGSIEITAEITRTGDITDTDLNIYFVVSEDVFYAGRNGVSNHKHVMRKILPSTTGQPFNINLSETKIIDQQVNIDPLWDADSLHVIVFVQSNSSKIVYQSSTISYNVLIPTNIENETAIPSRFMLEQNYPNPFNPITKIQYSVPKTDEYSASEPLVQLRVYDMLGNAIATLVNEQKPAGIYEINFNGVGLTSGIYFYRLTAGSFLETKKMILMK